MAYFGEMFHHLPGYSVIWGKKYKFICNSVLCIVIYVNLTTMSTAPAKFQVHHYLTSSVPRLFNRCLSS